MKSFIVNLLVVSALAVSYGAPNFFQTIQAHARSALREYPAEEKTATKREHVNVGKSACLDAHNRARASHKSGWLEWDAGLAEDAQKWADHLANDVGHMVHAQNTGEGENLFWSMGSHVANCEDAVRAWVSEEAYYRYDHPPRTFNEFAASKAGHFTQVVWKGTRKLGVAISTKGKAPKVETFIVARYSPPGNWLGEFSENVMHP